MRPTALFLFCALLCACSPEQRLSNLLARHPELSHRRDTVIHDTAIVEYVRADTTFLSVPGDTVTVTKDRLRIRYVDMPGDTVYLDGECMADTVFIEHAVPQQVITPCPEGYRVAAWWKTAALVVGGILALLILLAFLTRKR